MTTETEEQLKLFLAFKEKKEIDNAKRNEGRPDIPSDQAQNGRQGEGSTHRAVENRTILGNGKEAKKAPKHEVTLTEAIDKAIVKRAGLAFTSPKKLDRKVNRKFEKAVLKRMALYKCDALDALHDLAMMPIDDQNSSQNNIKYLACCTLIGRQGPDGKETTDLPETLQKLNEAYHSAATRIRSIRERVITFDDAPVSTVP